MQGVNYLISFCNAWKNDTEKQYYEILLPVHLITLDNLYNNFCICICLNDIIICLFYENWIDIMTLDMHECCYITQL